MASSPFVFPIAELRHERAAPKPVSVQEPVDWHLDLSRVLPEPPLQAVLELLPTSGGIVVSGRISARVAHTCHRCLDEWEEPLDARVNQLYVYEAGDDETDYVIDGIEIDLEPALRDEVLLALPLVPTCGDDCKGVVEATETGLNTPTPEDVSASASPFAVLKDLLDAGE
jgi:uncharacterized protein